MFCRRKQYVTINEIAKRANVSRTTVSRVINGTGYVRDELKKRVLQVIEETGYIPSENAKSLRTKKTNIIGVILPKISTETSSRLMNGIDQVLAPKGYQILLTITNQEPAKEIDFLHLLKGRNVDGIILSATHIDEALREEIKKLKIPFVMVGQAMEGTAGVVLDDFQATYDLVKLFIERGHKEIGFIGVTEEDRAVGYLRKLGYLKALKDNGLEIKHHWMQEGNFDADSGFQATENMAEEGELPSAIIAVTDRLAIGAMQYAKGQGLSIPSQLAIAGMGASEISTYIEPQLTTVDFSQVDAGVEAASILLEQLSGQKTDTVTVKNNYRILVRESI